MQDPRIESSLNSNPNIAWEYVHSVGLHQIDEKKSFANQARIQEPVDRSLVQQYQQATRSGDQFPAVVLFEDSPGVYVLIDGNHRYAANLAEKKTTTDAYIVVADDPTERTALTFELNTLNGRPTTEEDRAHQVVTLVHQGFTRQATAQRLHVPPKFVDEALADYAGLERARRIGVGNAYSKITTKYQRGRLHNGLSMDKTFALAVQYIAKFPVRNKDIPSFIDQVAAYGSEGDQANYVKARIAAATKEAEVQKKAGKTKRRGAAPHHLFNAHLVYLLEADVATMVLGMNSEEREALGKRVDTVISHLRDIEGNIISV